MSNVNTVEFIDALLDRVNEVIPATYAEAPLKDFAPIQAVVKALNVSSLESGYLAMFYIEVWADELQTNSTLNLIQACDNLRNHLDRAIISKEGNFTSHIGFEAYSDVDETEQDLSHRRLSFSARIFYI